MERYIDADGNVNLFVRLERLQLTFSDCVGFMEGCSED